MRAVFTVTDISLADTPVPCRRGVLFTEGDTTDRGWQVVVYDPRPEAFRAAVGLELPFSARTADGAFLTGWVRIGAGEREVGVQSLHGMGKLAVHRPWQTLPKHLRHTMQGRHAVAVRPRLTTAVRGGARKDGLAVQAPWRQRLALPECLRRLSSGQRLLAVAALTFIAWGLLHLVLDIGRAVEAPHPRLAAAVAPAAAPAAPTSAQPLLGSSVTIIERLGFGKHCVRLRDTLALSFLRADGVTELYALLPGGRRALAGLDGECVLVMRDLLGRRIERRALVRTTAVSDAHIYMSGWLSPR